jgi:hypothetical protein
MPDRGREEALPHFPVSMSTTEAPAFTPDAAAEAMVARAAERFRGSGRRRGLSRRRRERTALPNVLIVGGLKCGTTSVHHYMNLHPEIGMSRPKELNFFVEELNWRLGADWYRSHFSADAPVRGESSPHYTNHPRFAGVPERIRGLCPDARLIYMVRDPVKRMLSHYVHNIGGRYERRPIDEALGDPNTAYVDRSRYWTQLERYLAHFDPERIMVVAQEDLHERRAETMREIFAFVGVDTGFTSEQFSREWETSKAKKGKFTLMDSAVRLPGLRALDRNFDRLPEQMRWMVEKVIHGGRAEPDAKPQLDPALRDRLVDGFRDEVARLEEFCGRKFAWASSG